jgi:O-antigen/teichoic acid export membrane protein
MIALILGHPQAGLYGVALKPSAFFLGAIGLFSIALLSGYSAAPDGETTALFRRSVLLGSVSMTGVAIVLTAAAPLITLVFGHGYRGAATAMAVLGWTLPLAGLSVPYATVLVARHRQDVLMRNNIVGAVFFLAGNALLIPLVGVNGAAGVRVATYALMLLVNHNACVGRGLAPSLSEVFSGRLPRLVTGRGRA